MIRNKSFAFENAKKYLMSSMLITLLIFATSCTEDIITEDIIPEVNQLDKETEEVEELPEVTIDSLLIGDWLHIEYPNGIRLDKEGNVDYLMINQIDGAVEVESRYRAKIKAIDGRFQFLESNECFALPDSIYYHAPDTLRIPLSRGFNYGSQSYIRLNEERLQQRKRLESHMTADIEINGHWGTTNTNFEASDAFEYLNCYDGLNEQTTIAAYDNQYFDCNLGMDGFSALTMISEQKINGIGQYPMSYALSRNTFQENNLAYALSYSFPNFVSGSIQVLKYEVTGDFILLEGTFEMEFTSEFQEQTYPINVKNGNFKIYQAIE